MDTDVGEVALPAPDGIDDGAWRAAMHEAGHVVAMLHFERRFRYVTMRPRTPGARALTMPSRAKIPADDVVQYVIVCAGPAAEALATPDFAMSAQFGNGDGDFDILNELVDRGTREGIFQLALDVIWAHPDELVSIASALVMRSTLQYKDSLQIWDQFSL